MSVCVFLGRSGWSAHTAGVRLTDFVSSVEVFWDRISEIRAFTKSMLIIIIMASSSALSQVNLRRVHFIIRLKQPTSTRTPTYY